MLIAQKTATQHIICEKPAIPVPDVMKPTKSAGESVVPIWRMSVMVAMATVLSPSDVLSRIM